RFNQEDFRQSLRHGLGQQVGDQLETVLLCAVDIATDRRISPSKDFSVGLFAIHETFGYGIEIETPLCEKRDVAEMDQRTTVVGRFRRGSGGSSLANGRQEIRHVLGIANLAT